MIKNLNVLMILFGIIFLSNCEAVYKKHIIGEYYLIAIDIIEQNAVGYREGETGYLYVIPASVFAVGNNNDFIVAKQHPCYEGGYEPNMNITNYYIIPLKDKKSEIPNKNKIGPLTKEEFEQKRKELGISKNIDFTIVIDELE